jgi:hypothetical protein
MRKPKNDDRQLSLGLLLDDRKNWARDNVRWHDNLTHEERWEALHKIAILQEIPLERWGVPRPVTVTVDGWTITVTPS